MGPGVKPTVDCRGAAPTPAGAASRQKQRAAASGAIPASPRA
jgi:hypothetical protein